MWVVAVNNFFCNSKIGRFAPQKPSKTRFLCLFARCTPNRSVYKPDIWHVCAICMLIAAAKNFFFVIRKFGALRPKNLQNPDYITKMKLFGNKAFII